MYQLCPKFYQRDKLFKQFNDGFAFFTRFNFATISQNFFCQGFERHFFVAHGDSYSTNFSFAFGCFVNKLTTPNVHRIDIIEWLDGRKDFFVF